MARPCTICAHEQLEAIDTALIERQSFRHIASQFRVSTTALQRHRNDHLPRLLAENAQPAQASTIGPEPAQERSHSGTLRAQVEQRQERRSRHALDIMAELSQQLERINLLSDAVDAWLRDPDDPSRYEVGPRAEDISVVYQEPVAEIVPGVTAYSARKKEKLSVLLRRLQETGLAIEMVETKHADPRKLLLDAATGLKGQLELAMSILDKLYGAQEVEHFQAAVLEAIGEVAPDVRSQIVDNLQRASALRRALGAPGR